MPVTFPLDDHDAKAEQDRRRIQCLTVDGDVFLSMLLTLQRPGVITYLPKGQLPNDARVVGLAHDPSRNGVNIFLHSMTFEPCDQSMTPPPVSLKFGLIRMPHVDQDGVTDDSDIRRFIDTAQEAGLL